MSEYVFRNPAEYADLLAETINQNLPDEETLLIIKKIIEDNLNKNFESLKENCIISVKKLEKEKTYLEKFKGKSPEAKIKAFIKKFSDDGYDVLSEKNKKRLSQIISSVAGKSVELVCPDRELQRF